MYFLILCRENDRKKYSCLRYAIERNGKMSVWMKFKGKVDYYKSYRDFKNIAWDYCPCHSPFKREKYPDATTPFSERRYWWQR